MKYYDMRSSFLRTSVTIAYINQFLSTPGGDVRSVFTLTQTRVVFFTRPSTPVPPVRRQKKRPHDARRTFPKADCIPSNHHHAYSVARHPPLRPHSQPIKPITVHAQYPIQWTLFLYGPPPYKADSTRCVTVLCYCVRYCARKPHHRGVVGGEGSSETI